VSIYQYFLIIDLEATCSHKKEISRREMEIIEIGAVMLEANTLEVVSEFQTFIKPVRYPILTDFCRQLTSITQQQVDNAPLYRIAIANFKQWLDRYSNFIFGSWGDYDRQQLKQDCNFHSLPYPINSEHINLKKMFSKSQGFSYTHGMAKALELAGIELKGIHHRGIDDARNIARLMPYILGRKLLTNVSSG
jgi:inhibitor of KinA sporulation pathway (predicted exonuclease)